MHPILLPRAARLLTLALLFTAFLGVWSAQAASPDVLISQVYGGGGNSGATLTHDFIELFNRGSAPVSLAGWTVQYASTTGSTWAKTDLAGTLQPGQYYLIQQAPGAGGTTPLPTPDTVGTLLMSATNGKVALVNSTTLLSGACPLGGSVVDFVGFGSSANCFEGAGPTPNLSNTTAALRGNVCVDSDQNGADFVTGSPTPRNTASPFTSCAGPTNPSGVGAANPDPLNNQVFQLYNLDKDFTQSEDLAAKYPEKVKELKAKFVAEAKKYQVFPLDASVAARIIAPRPNITAGRSEFVYTRPMVGLPQGDSPVLLNTSYTITADIEVPEDGAEGMILTSGGRFAGYGFYLLKGKPVFLWNMIDLERIKWEATDALGPGKHTVEFDFKYEGLGVGTLLYNNMSGLGRPGTGVLKVDGKTVMTQKMEKTLPMILQWDESFDIGSDTLTGVNDADYQPPFALTAKLNKLTLKVDRPQLSADDVKRLETAVRNNRTSE